MAVSQLEQTLQLSGLRPPKTLTLAITGACNLNCGHCWVQAGEAASAGHVPSATIRRLIEEFAALGGEGVRLTGGEPLCHPDWLELLRFAVSSGFSRVTLQTNGMLFDEDSVAALVELDFPGFVVQLSFDGASAATHDLVRGDGAFESLMLGTRRLAGAGLGPHIAIFFTEMGHNLEEIQSLLAMSWGWAPSPPAPWSFADGPSQGRRSPRLSRLSTCAFWNASRPMPHCENFMKGWEGWRRWNGALAAHPARSHAPSWKTLISPPTAGSIPAFCAMPIPIPSPVSSTKTSPRPLSKAHLSGRSCSR